MADELAFGSTATHAVPASAIDQVIGQEHAVEVIRLAARQRRAVLLVGEPGTGKSMLAAAMAELMPAGSACDVLVHANPDARTLPRVEEVPAGTGSRVVEQANARHRQERQGIAYLLGVAIGAVLLLGVLVALVVTPYAAAGGAFAAILLVVLRRRLLSVAPQAGVRLLIDRSGQERAPFVDATGAQAGGLLGDVRHDPYQSGGFETEAHELVEPGAIHRAHGGVLFVDEISSLSLESQQRLLTALQEGRLAITGRHSGSSGAMVRTDPVPCDTVLVVAANPEELPSIHPALRSRLRGFGFEVLTADSFERTPEHEAAIARFVAQEIRRDGRIPHFAGDAVAAVVEEAARRAEPGRLTLRLRELGGLVRAAGDLAAAEGVPLVDGRHVEEARALALSIEEQAAMRASRERGVLRQIPVEGHDRQTRA
ncbi:MAG: ATP-dependent Lon protease [Solirubrobacteraceae bacterium]|jgi:Lon-like ATP-dependent protease|nr:ATP-dependent Lon protease [Solirubrobacteraceae bacterium]